MKHEMDEKLAVLKDFLLDIECLDKLSVWTDKVNLFDILKVSRTEIRHSNMLAWLLDPNENHGLGQAFIQGVLQQIITGNKFSKYDGFKLLLMDLYSFRVLREWKNIDILLLSEDEKVVVAIENKIGSGEHDNQLDRYREILEKEYADYLKIYLFLTPDGTLPSDTKNWDVLTYSHIEEILCNLYKTKSLHTDIEIIIRNYIDVIRRDIVKDDYLVRICNEIYNKHKKALDLIFENRLDGSMQLLDAVSDALLKLSEENVIVYKKEWKKYFRTRSLDKLLPLVGAEDNYWNSYCDYYYWIRMRDGEMRGILEFAGINVPTAQMEIMNQLIDIQNPKDTKRDNYKSKRIFSSNTKKCDMEECEDLYGTVELLVRDMVGELLIKEKTLLERWEEEHDKKK